MTQRNIYVSEEINNYLKWRARSGKSVSQYISNLIVKDIKKIDKSKLAESEQAKLDNTLEMLDSVLNGETHVKTNG